MEAAHPCDKKALQTTVHEPKASLAVIASSVEFAQAPPTSAGTPPSSAPQAAPTCNIAQPVAASPAANAAAVDSAADGQLVTIPYAASGQSIPAAGGCGAQPAAAKPRRFWQLFPNQCWRRSPASAVSWLESRLATDRPAYLRFPRVLFLRDEHLLLHRFLSDNGYCFMAEYGHVVQYRDTHAPLAPVTIRLPAQPAGAKTLCYCRSPAAVVAWLHTQLTVYRVPYVRIRRQLMNQDQHLLVRHCLEGIGYWFMGEYGQVIQYLDVATVQAPDVSQALPATSQATAATGTASEHALTSSTSCTPAMRYATVTSTIPTGGTTMTGGRCGSANAGGQQPLLSGWARTAVASADACSGGCTDAALSATWVPLAPSSSVVSFGPQNGTAAGQLVVHISKARRCSLFGRKHTVTARCELSCSVSHQQARRVLCIKLAQLAASLDQRGGRLLCEELQLHITVCKNQRQPVYASKADLGSAAVVNGRPLLGKLTARQVLENAVYSLQVQSSADRTVSLAGSSSVADAPAVDCSPIHTEAPASGVQHIVRTRLHGSASNAPAETAGETITLWRNLKAAAITRSLGLPHAGLAFHGNGDPLILQYRIPPTGDVELHCSMAVRYRMIPDWKVQQGLVQVELTHAYQMHTTTFEKLIKIRVSA